MKRTIWLLLALLVLIVLVVLVYLPRGSSGPKMYPVTGMVTYDEGKVLPKQGTIRFVPKDRTMPPSKLALIDEDGRYRLEAVAGEHSVEIVVIPSVEGAVADETREGGFDYTNAKPATSPIDGKYGRYHESGIPATVEATGLNTIDIEIPPQ